MWRTNKMSHGQRILYATGRHPKMLKQFQLLSSWNDMHNWYKFYQPQILKDISQLFKIYNLHAKKLKDQNKLSPKLQWMLDF